MSGKSVLQEKSFLFAIEITKTFKELIDKKEFVMSKQLLRSGTSVGAMVREAKNAESKADFIHKLGVAQKECDETIYWLELLQASGYLSLNEFERMSGKANEILKMLRSSILTLKGKVKTP
ncbi:MAG TPA: four helix bundle protein [Bacteroidia bacterium]|nr:four helix bundle protein [Bacteroidia bacterium]